MARYEWRGVGPYHDRQGDRTIEPGDLVEIDAHLADPHPEFYAVGDDPTDDADDEAAWDADEWLDGNYQDRADMVRTGAVDDYLDQIEDAETSDTVLEAVEARRDELGD